MANRKLYVYQLTHNITGKKYIGSSFSAGNRISTHLNKFVAGDHENKEMQKDSDEYGIDWSFKVLKILETENRDEEFRTIKELDTTNPCIGYNVAGPSRELVDETRKIKKAIQLCERKINFLKNILATTDFSCDFKDGEYCFWDLVKEWSCKGFQVLLLEWVKTYPHKEQTGKHKKYYFRNMCDFGSYISKRLEKHIVFCEKQLAAKRADYERNLAILESSHE